MIVLCSIASFEHEPQALLNFLKEWILVQGLLRFKDLMLGNWELL